MNVVLNGRPRALEAGATVASVVRALHDGALPRGIAVAVDGEVVRRGEWSVSALCEGARIEVLGAIGGGR